MYIHIAVCLYDCPNYSIYMYIYIAVCLYDCPNYSIYMYIYIAVCMTVFLTGLPLF